jgi:hypothetical protein
MFSFWRAKPEDEMKKAIEQAVAADREARYEEAVRLYAAGIEKMMVVLNSPWRLSLLLGLGSDVRSVLTSRRAVCLGGAFSALKEEDRRTAMRRMIDEYMTRAELLKDWVAQQRADIRAQQTPPRVPKERGQQQPNQPSRTQSQSQLQSQPQSLQSQPSASKVRGVRQRSCHGVRWT